MTEIAIRVENLGKMYRIGTEDRRPATFWQAARQLAASPFEYLRRITRPPTEAETLWALKDVSFEVKRGEVVGIIGRNGAGKSTLLKILSRITEPTHGHAQIHGRVGSLLEVGTGFHPELTGRENIYLNGAILGMKRVEIDRKFDEIVAFAEIERFLDTPVKRYSSGMYVRLAFAVAAHLEPEILLVDEVLAVGDAEFQRKCLGKIGDISGEGRTVLLVSHNMTSIAKLCDIAIWVEKGCIGGIGPAEKTIQSYLATGLLAMGGQVAFSDPDETKEAFISAIELRNGNDEVAADFEVLSPIKVNIMFFCRRNFSNFRIDALVSRYDGVPVFATTSQDYDLIQTRFVPGVYCAQMLIPGQFLASGDYYLSVNICEVGVKNYDLRESVLRFRISGDPLRIARDLGFLVYPFEWKLMMSGGKEINAA
ncbi:MAG: ABC transporter ATP-binding protein [Anaerolineae bacterium]|nr:ABC transporter ATP-binding protein [Anaerolineae bacterium]